MTARQQDFDALLGSRICHDLINPLGAIANGMELLGMSGAAQGPEFALISESIEHANARIRFFRVAFGVASPGQQIGAQEVQSILSGLSAGSKLSMTWNVTGGIERTEAKLAFLLLQCLETAMPWGGSIAVRAVGAGFSLIGQAERFKPLPDLWPHLGPEPVTTGVGAPHVHFPLAARSAAELGRPITPNIGEEVITLTF